MDVLDLKVSTEEIQTLNEDLRPVWDTEGMTCPVTKCPSHQTQFRSYITHWTKMHVSTKKFFKCSSCKKIIQAKHKAQHGRQHNTNIEFTIMTVINKEYIDPKSCVPTKLFKKIQNSAKASWVPKENCSKKKKTRRSEITSKYYYSFWKFGFWYHNSRDEKLYFF